MSLETGSRIQDLVATNPVGATDFISQGDDHIRLLKACIQGSLPNLGATAVVATAEELNILDGAILSTAELNFVDGVTSGIQAQFSAMDAAKQPLDSDLSAIATLTTAAYGRDFLVLVDNAALATKIAALVPTWIGAHTHTAKLTSNVSTGQALRLVSGSSQVAHAETGSGLGCLFEFAGNGQAVGSASVGIGQDGSGDGVVLQRANKPLRIGTNGIYRASYGASGGVELLSGGASPTGGNKGDGTINAAADIYINGEPLALRNLLYRLMTGSDSTDATDAGRSIVYTGAGGHTLTLDSDLPDTGVCMVFNAGTAALSVAHGNLNWYNGSGTISTGTRTLAVGAIATVWRIGGAYNIWGTGIS